MRYIVVGFEYPTLPKPWCMRAVVAGAVQMLEQGFSADSADYDGRTALMLCAGKGHTGAQTADACNALCILSTSHNAC